MTGIRWGKGAFKKPAETPEFAPLYHPAEMLEQGIFGGAYFLTLAEYEELPEEWRVTARLSASGRPDPSVNKFGVLAGMSLAEWRKRDWIKPHDPCGWFQWYCRYEMGRRVPGYDDWQIRRWANFRDRHPAMCHDPVTPRERQGLLQWSCDPFFDHAHDRFSSLTR